MSMTLPGSEGGNANGRRRNQCLGGKLAAWSSFMAVALWGDVSPAAILRRPAWHRGKGSLPVARGSGRNTSLSNERDERCFPKSQASGRTIPRGQKGGRDMQDLPREILHVPAAPLRA